MHSHHSSLTKARNPRLISLNWVVKIETFLYIKKKNFFFQKVEGYYVKAQSQVLCKIKSILKFGSVLCDYILGSSNINNTF